MTSNTEVSDMAEAPAAQEPKASKAARAGAGRAYVAPHKGKSGQNVSPAKKAPKAKKGTKSKESAGPREGSKTDRILGLLKRPEGVTAKELMKMTGWQPHSFVGSCPGPSARRWASP